MRSPNARPAAAPWSTNWNSKCRTVESERAGLSLRSGLDCPLRTDPRPRGEDWPAAAARAVVRTPGMSREWWLDAGSSGGRSGGWTVPSRNGSHWRDPCWSVAQTVATIYNIPGVGWSCGCSIRDCDWTVPEVCLKYVCTCPESWLEPIDGSGRQRSTSWGPDTL